uniref:Glypican-6-like n=1 Tax=Petromyzon marinus TaxID=7757 RepID=A0AAJ7UHM5_PETMA|nr:glypican-6-like [Petromyzon marinus]
MEQQWLRLTVGLVLSAALAWRGCGAKARACGEARQEYRASGFSLVNVPHHQIPGEGLRVCASPLSCCTLDMEQQLEVQSRLELEESVAESSHFLRSTFSTRHHKFDEFFRELVNNAERSLHDMFVRTYGELFTQNAHLFTNLFSDLRLYYGAGTGSSGSSSPGAGAGAGAAGGAASLDESLADFWMQLLTRMMELVNPQLRFTPEYLRCVASSADGLKPFGDVPRKLRPQLGRAFVSARAFVAGLAVGRDVVTRVTQLPVTGECAVAMTRMLHCPLCRGVVSARPCAGFCLNVVKGCLANQADLNAEWNNFLDAMLMVAERLEGPFNIEAVLDLMDVKISDAIMNMQENSVAISEQVFAGCGRLRSSPPGRSQRSALDALNQHFRSVQPEERPTTAAGTSLDRLVTDVKAKLKAARSFWLTLPYSVCNSDKVAAAPMGSDDGCWNGQSMGRYAHELVGDGLARQRDNPEVAVDVTRPDPVVRQQIMALRLATRRLRQAHAGNDVQLPGYDDEGGDDEGDGSGSGSGDSEDPTAAAAAAAATRQPDRGRARGGGDF